MRDLALKPSAFDHAWQLLQYCFDFPDPATAVPVSTDLAGEQALLVRRFTTKAASLASSPFMAHDTFLKVHIDDDGQGETIEANFPHEESARGFLTLLRQFCHADEEGSFKRVQRIADLGARTTRQNVDLLAAWGKYHRKLLTHTPMTWGYRKALSRQPPDQIPLQSGPRVDVVLRTYFYGDIIHFGEKRDELATLSEVAFTDASTRMTLHEGAFALALFYMGYATILNRIYPSLHRG